MTTKQQTRVAVIGAGINGICAMRRLLEDGEFKVTCFERNHDVGGIWLYSEEIIVNETGKTISSPVYATLRSNVPKQLIMNELEGFSMDGIPQFPTHKDLLKYIHHIAEKFDLRKNIKFRTEVKTVKSETIEEKTEWRVEYKDLQTKSIHTETFDALINSNGNSYIPRYPQIEGEHQFQGTIIHSCKYRHPENFRGQTVLILGAHISGIDIAFDIAPHAKQVYICHRGPKLEIDFLDNMIQKSSGIKRFSSHSVVLENNDELSVETVIYCTRYKYDFSYFFGVNLKIGPNNMVCNLYKSIMSTDHENLFFMGIPREVPFFPLGDHQALFIKAVLNGTARLPDKNKMAEVVSADAGRSIGKHTWWNWDQELSEIAGNFEPIQPGVKKIWDYNVSGLQTNFLDSRKYEYSLTGPDSFIVS